MQSDSSTKGKKWKKKVDLTQQTAPAELFLIVPIYLPPSSNSLSESHITLSPWIQRAQQILAAVTIEMGCTQNLIFQAREVREALGPSWTLLQRTRTAESHQPASPCAASTVLTALCTPLVATEEPCELL